jgi:hypothetical protein
MEDFIYICTMSVLNNLAYYNNIIAELITPELSLGTDILIGSSDSHSSISDYIENKTKCVGSFILSMSQISFCKTISQVKALLSSNFRPNHILQLPKLSFFRLSLYQTNW